MKIFIVEDDVIIRNEICEFLLRYKFECESSDDFENIVSLVLKSNADLVLLDINLPFFDGFQVCREVREKSGVPIIIVTSRNTSMDELMSLQIGADDFITKPYDLPVLLAHIQAVLKRSNQMGVRLLLTHNGLALDISKSKMQYEDKEVDLSKNESTILRVLMENRGNIVSRDELISEIWQDGDFVDENTLNVNISRLRKKLESISLQSFLITKRNLGYQI